MIQIEHLNKTYVSRQGETHIALTDINLTIEDGSVFGIIGQSGAGKSTLVRCLNLLERPTSGSIIINGRDITSLSEKELREFRSSVSMVFQNFSLLQQRTVLRNVMFPLELRHADKKEAEKRARELLELVGLADKCECLGEQPVHHVVRRGHQRTRLHDYAFHLEAAERHQRKDGRNHRAHHPFAGCCRAYLRQRGGNR